MAFSDIFPQIIENTPFMKAIGATLDRVDGEGVTMRLPWREDLIGDAESRVIASGVVTALLDNGCGMAVWDKVNEFKSVATLDLRIDYMRPAKAEVDLLVTAKCYRLTRTVGFVRAFAYETTPDDPVAAAQAAFVITAPPKAPQ